MPDDLTVLANLVNQHLQWYPQMEVQDVYKLLYQGVMGSEHLVSSEEKYVTYLEDEYASIQADNSLRLFEPVRPDALLLRINLRAHKSRQLNIQQLVSPLVQTAQMTPGSNAEIQQIWDTFCTLCQQGHMDRFEPGILDNFSRQIEQLEFPAVHHSVIYRQAYQPSYRLIAARFTTELGLTDEG